MSRSDVEKFCRASSQLQTLKAAHSQSMKKLLLKRKELRRHFQHATCPAAMCTGSHYVRTEKAELVQSFDGGTSTRSIRSACASTMECRDVTCDAGGVKSVAKESGDSALDSPKRSGTQILAVSEEARALAQQLAEVEDQISDRNTAI